MFQHQFFTQPELDADPRLAALVRDKQALLDTIERIAELNEPSPACDMADQARLRHIGTERQREAAHHAAVQAENVRRGWRPATLREILGEPQYVPHEPGSKLVDHEALRRASPDGCCHWARREGWPCPLKWECPHDRRGAGNTQEREQDDG